MNDDAKPVCDARRDDGRYCADIAPDEDRKRWWCDWCAERAPAEGAPARDREDAKARLRAAIAREADKVRQQLPLGFQGRGNLAAVAAAADRLARAVFDFTHGEECRGDLDGDDQECRQCMGDMEGPCSCTCDMCGMWRDALIVRPQGVGDPQPAPGAGR